MTIRRAIGLSERMVAPLTGGYRIPRPGARTGFDSSGDRRLAARSVNGWPKVLSAKVPRQSGAFLAQRSVVSKDARRKGPVAHSRVYGSAEDDDS
jgi:hypothetical protein